MEIFYKKNLWIITNIYYKICHITKTLSFNADTDTNI